MERKRTWKRIGKDTLEGALYGVETATVVIGSLCLADILVSNAVENSATVYFFLKAVSMATAVGAALGTLGFFKDYSNSGSVNSTGDEGTFYR